jgi:hypothetical protein
MTKLFLDTEFTGLHQNTTLISLALVADTGEEFYAESTWYDETQINPWLQEHVLGNRLLYPEVANGQKLRNVIYPGRLSGGSKMMEATNSYGANSPIVNGVDIGCQSYYGDPGLFLVYLNEWLGKFAAVEVYSDTYAYDWVLFCELFGGALNLPRHIYYIPFDLSTLFKVLGIDPDVNREKFASTMGWTDTLQQHNALHDARVQKRCYEVCRDLIRDGTKRVTLL